MPSGKTFATMFTLKRHKCKNNSDTGKKITCPKCHNIFNVRYYKESKHSLRCKKLETEKIRENKKINDMPKQQQSDHNKANQSKISGCIPPASKSSALLNVIQQSVIDVGGIDHEGIVSNGLIFAFEHLNLRLRMPSQYVLGDGNCVQRAWALALGCPEVRLPDTWFDKATNLRTDAVRFVRSQLHQNRVDVPHILNLYPHMQDLDAELKQLEGDGQYAQDMGDFMMQIISSHQQC